MCALYKSYSMNLCQCEAIKVNLITPFPCANIACPTWPHIFDYLGQLAIWHRPQASSLPLTHFQRYFSLSLSVPFRWKLSAISTWPSLGCQTIVRITPSAWLVLLWTWWTWPRTLRWAPIQWWVQFPYSFFTFSQLLVVICLVKGLRLWDTM